MAYQAADPAAYPSLAETIEHLTAESFNDRFTYGIDLILTGHSDVQRPTGTSAVRVE